MPAKRAVAASSANSASAFDAPMTVAGATALSVDTSTKRPTPSSPATCATTRVAIALLRTASTGLASISPTCLYAAAWNTTVGRCSEKTSRMRSSSLQSASTAESIDGDTWRSSSSSRWIEKRLSSAWSSSTIRCGSTRAIWRHSSAPIEPPAPVTSTVSPARYAPTFSSSICTGSRPSTSSTRTSRIWRASAPRVCSSSNTVGSVRTGMPRARHSRTIRARVDPGAEGIAMITSSGSASSRMRGRSPSVLPRTRTPSIRRRRLLGSSSTKPTGVRPSPRLRTISRSTSRPPSPAPAISTLRWPLRPPRNAASGRRS